MKQIQKPNKNPKQGTHQPMKTLFLKRHLERSDSDSYRNPMSPKDRGKLCEMVNCITATLQHCITATLHHCNTASQKN
jgi:hypothetical protein